MPVIIFSLSPLYYLKFFLFLLINCIYFLFYIKEKDVDIICSNSLLLVFPGLLSKLLGKKHVWFIREFFNVTFIDKIFGRIVNCFSDIIICQSKAIKNKLFLSDRAKVVYEPIDFANYRMYSRQVLRDELKISHDSIIMSIVSRIHPSKGQFKFIEGIKEVLLRDKQLFLLIVGDSSIRNLRSYLYKRKIRELINNNNLKRVMLLGFREDVDKIFSASDVCVFPFQREEPFGIAVAESLIFGGIVFFPRTGGLKEIFNIFNRGKEYDIKEVTEVIENLKTNSSDKQKKLEIPKILSVDNYKNQIKGVFNL